MLVVYYLGIILLIINIVLWIMLIGLGVFFNINGSVVVLLVVLFNLVVVILIYFFFVVVVNKVQNVIEQEESEEDIVNVLKF